MHKHTPTIVSNIFANSQTIFRFCFSLKQSKPTQSATIILTLWISIVQRTNCKAAFCFGAIARKGACTVISRLLAIARTFGRHSCVARATAICILHIVEGFRSYSTIKEK